MELLGNGSIPRARKEAKPGKFADLVIVDGDPLASIENLRQIRLVVEGGKAYQPKTLLDEACARAHQKQYEIHALASPLAFPGR